jgi:hypothetical protein
VNPEPWKKSDNPMSGGGRVPRAERVHLAQADRVHAERLGDPLHVDFGGELRLRRAESPERAVGRRVRHHDPAVDADVVATVGPRRMNDPSREDDGGERHVRAPVQEDVDVDRGQTAVARHAGAMPDPRGVTLRRRDHVLDAVVHELDRPAGLEREDRGVSRDHRRILLLAPESAAGLCLDDPHLVAGQPEEHPERPVDVVRALERAVDGDAAVLRHRDDAVRLDVELLLVSGAVFPLDDDVRRGEAAPELPLLDHDLLEAQRRAFRVVERLGGPVLDRDPAFGVEERVAALVRDEEDRLGEVTDLAFREAGLVELDQRDRVPARNVPEVGDGELGAVEVEPDPRDLSARDRRADRPPVEHPGKGEVVDVLRPAGDLVDSLFAEDVSPDRCRLPIGAHGWARMLPHAARRLSTPRASGPVPWWRG